MKQENEIRIIIDTNLWISFLIGRKLSSLLDLLSYPEFQLVISTELIEEIHDVVSRPKLAKYYSSENVNMLMKYMKDFSLLFSALLKHSFRFDFAKAKGQKKWTMILLYGIVAICCLPMLGLVAYLLYQLGALAQQIDATVGFLTCIFGIVQIITLLFGIATVLNTIYFSKDNEMLLAYPIKPQTIFAVKLAFVYIIELISSFATSIFMVIPFVIGAKLPFSIGLVVSFFILPLLPLFVATIVAIPLMYAMSFFKNKGVLSSLACNSITEILYVKHHGNSEVMSRSKCISPP